LLREARAAKDNNRKSLILGLKHAEETRRCFALVRATLNPSTPGGLTHLLIPDKHDHLQWVRVSEVADMDDLLLEHSRQHFRQAHGTPFTKPPLSTLLGFDGLTPFGDQIFQGAPIPDDLNIIPATRLLLLHQRSLLKPHERNTHPLEFDALMQGFRRWPECTTTSPSGRHLGLYKSLLKDSPPANPPPDYVPWMHGIDIMRYVYRLLQLALRHTHVFECWKTVWNMYLKKTRPPTNRFTAHTASL